MNETEKLKFIIDELAVFFKNDVKKVVTWFDMDNLLFGGASPIQLIKRGKLDKVYSFVKTSLAENKPEEPK